MRIRTGIKQSVLVTLAVAVTIMAGLLAFAHVAGEQTSRVAASRVPNPPLRVVVASARRESGFSVRREFVGRVEARRESPVGFELAGRVVAVVPDEGDVVEAGAVLARLDTQRLEARRRELVARRERALADLELAEITRTRMRDARDRDAVPPQAWDEADKDYSARKAVLAEADSAIASIDVELEKSTLRSPFKALVAGRHVDEGRVVSTGEPVLHLLERVAPEVRVAVAGEAVDELEPGSRQTIRVRQTEVEAVVRSVLPVRGRGTRSVDVVLTLDAELDGMRQGDLATLAIDRRIEEPGSWLPRRALTESSRGLWAVYVAGIDGDRHRLERRQLELLHQDSDRVYVRGALGEDALVVVEGLQRIVPGQVVRPVSRRGDELIEVGHAP